ncbi:MAG: adenylate kinase [Candidatus Hydrogenedentes bacterium]|nr:adenylate kinase [Candidatus Hydrogenedentota bacterium]
MRIVLLGAPGAGKGTQAQRIAAARKMPHVSTGDIFRDHLQRKTDLAREIEPYMESGSLVPDELTCAIVAQRLCEPDCRGGYVLDGFPRSLRQAETLERLLGERTEKLDVALDIQVSDHEIVERLTARRVCPECGAIYNLKYDPPRNGDTRCSKNGCTGTLMRRPDDTAETIRQRLLIYHETTEPIRMFYDERGLLRTVVSDNLTPEAVFVKFEEILCAMEAAGKA